MISRFKSHGVMMQNEGSENVPVLWTLALPHPEG